MHVTIVRIRITAESRDEFLDATRINHEASVREPGNKRFDVLEDPDDSCRFLLYEWYDTADDAAAHRETEHFITWRDTVESMMAEPRRPEVFSGLYPVW